MVAFMPNYRQDTFCVAVSSPHTVQVEVFEMRNGSELHKFVVVLGHPGYTTRSGATHVAGVDY